MIHPSSSAARSPVPAAVWIGEPRGDEATLAYGWLADRLKVVQVPDFDAAMVLELPADPMVVVFPLPFSGAIVPGDLAAIARRWPLSPLVAVCMSVVDGRRRSGPLLPGVIEVPWHELPGRIGQWLRHREAGWGGPLGLPWTFRREERLLSAMADGGRRLAAEAGSTPVSAALAASTHSDLDGLADLAVMAGCRVASRTIGRPAPDDPADVVLWDLQDVAADVIAWVARLVEARGERPVIVFESFPRGATARELRAAGSGHLLGRPVEAEVLAETIAWCRKAMPAGLGRPRPCR